MDVDAARTELIRASRAGGPDGSRFAGAHEVLIRRGIEALRISPHRAVSLADIVRIAAEAAPDHGRREFAVLLVCAIGVPGLVAVRGKTEQQLQSFLEGALLNPLRRAGYPFGGSVYEKRQVLAQLHATIDEHLRPLEPSIPRWIHGLGSPDEA